VTCALRSASSSFCAAIYRACWRHAGAWLARIARESTLSVKEAAYRGRGGGRWRQTSLFMVLHLIFFFFSLKAEISGSENVSDE